MPCICQATYLTWANQLQSNITRLRALEAAAAQTNASDATNTTSSSSFQRFTAPADLPFSQLFSDWVAANVASWQPQQLSVANALMTINVQVGETMVANISASDPAMEQTHYQQSCRCRVCSSCCLHCGCQPCLRDTVLEKKRASVSVVHAWHSLSSAAEFVAYWCLLERISHVLGLPWHACCCCCWYYRTF